MKKVADRRVQKVLELQAAGKSRDEIAEIFSYSSYRSLQQYMRRKNYAWNSDSEIYEFMGTVEDDVEQDDTTVVRDAKILKILASFDTEYPDPKKIAEALNFENYDAMKEYMLERNYVWDPKEQNYAKSENAVKVDVDVDVGGDVDYNNPSKKEFLDYLYDNRKILKRVLSRHMSGKDLPNYIIRGDSSTKTMYISTELSNLITEYCKKCNITQRQLIEGALIEFLISYGYESEIEKLLE